ncbi:hypothetical protein D893_02678 [Thioalkalivibrio sp. ALE21]|uniref:hypothetical protein n=1 Tax=Thioalkalivibrio sp. ALE21 TaxID=1158175 RepID=UPI000D9842D9|nr:hypothetical protein [Thioalkalivibrio sp. ALE21]PYF99429.1 hypothetical protein D893_02678 [Thioalkalivibrio sp. ALE21]
MPTSNRESIRNDRRYVGLYNDLYGGMTPIGNIIRDAWVFGILPEEQTCDGWEIGQIQALQSQVNAKWDEYGLRPSALPDDLRERHERIHNEAIERAREHGWVPGRDIDSDMDDNG